MVMPFSSARSRASSTELPELLLPSPEMSMTRRSAAKGAFSIWRTE
jgi:hypothetical protein